MGRQCPSSCSTQASAAVYIETSLGHGALETRLMRAALDVCFVLLDLTRGSAIAKSNRYVLSDHYSYLDAGSVMYEGWMFKSGAVISAPVVHSPRPKKHKGLTTDIRLHLPKAQVQTALKTLEFQSAVRMFSLGGDLAEDLIWTWSRDAQMTGRPDVVSSSHSQHSHGNLHGEVWRGQCPSRLVRLFAPDTTSCRSLIRHRTSILVRCW